MLFDSDPKSISSKHILVAYTLCKRNFKSFTTKISVSRKENKDMEKRQKSKLLEFIKEHIKQNYKEYMVILIFFVVGIFLGVFFINHTEESLITEVHQYLGDFINEVKDVSDINQTNILKSTLLDKLYLTIAIWFFGTTIIGIPIVFGLVAYRGFCLGYTISAIISFMGFTKGFTFVLVTLLLQNILFIPFLIGLAVSGFKFYKSIIRDRQKENIKISFIRHTIFSILMFGGLCASSFIEVFVSTNLLKLVSVYF